MKKSMLVLSLCLPLFAHSAPVTNNQTLKLISSLDLKDANLSLQLSEDKLSLTGSLPTNCSERLSLSDVQHYDASQSPEDLKDNELNKIEDLKEYASSIQAQITFAADDQFSTLKECLDKSDPESEKVDLSKESRFSRTVSLHPELAIAGLLGEPMNLKSPEYIKMEKQIQKLDCKDCNSNWKLLSAHLSEAKGLNSPILTSIMNKLFNESLEEIDKKFETVSTFDSLVRLRDQLIEMSAFTMNEEQSVQIMNLFEKVSDKNHALSHTGFKTATMATRHVDFAKETYAKMANIPAIPEDKKIEYKDKASSLALGKDDRIQMISSIDGDHPEVRQYVEESKKVQRNLQNQYQMSCMGRSNQYNFTQCGEIYNRLIAQQINSAKVESEYASAQNQKWNGIFSAWDNKNISYNSQWRTNFMLTTPSNSLNSKSYMYDPRNQQYSNFDASSLYQYNNVAPEKSSLYSPQDWSSPTVVQ